MGSYYYLEDKNSENGFTPVPEDEYVQAVFRVAKKRGLNITDKMILENLSQMNQKKGEKSSD